MTIARQMPLTISVCSGRKHNNLLVRNLDRLVENGGIRTKPDVNHDRRGERQCRLSRPERSALTGATQAARKTLTWKLEFASQFEVTTTRWRSAAILGPRLP